MKLYVDESGTISNSKLPNHRFFIICLVECQNHNKIIREFRQAKKDYIEQNPSCRFSIKDEIKGSEMPYGMKKMIFERLKERTDIVFHYKVIDNRHLVDSLKNSPSIAFNYLIGLSIKEIFTNSSTVETDLFMLIDERNQSVGSLNSLQEYLQIEFSIKTNHIKTVTVKYKDSKTKDLIQISDIFVNTIYRICTTHAKKGYDRRNRNLLSICRVGVNDYFPRKHNELDIFQQSD